MGDIKRARALGTHYASKIESLTMNSIAYIISELHLYIHDLLIHIHFYIYILYFIH